MSIKLIVGLGNPGNTYQETRHNVGAWLVNLLAKNYSATFTASAKMRCEHCVITIESTDCKLMLPTTFMNESGSALYLFSNFYRIETHEILVVHDDLDLDIGTIKLKTGGGHGGHNGLRDIINKLGSNDFHRLRIGIGHPGHKELVSNYVLTKPNSNDTISLNQAIEQTVKGLPLLFSANIAKAMNSLNS